MAFTAQELQNIANSIIDFHERGPVKSQVKQSRPLFDALMASKKPFPGGKEFITGRAKGTYTAAFAGYEGDDELAYVNPANIKQYQAKWYELFIGIKFTGTELKKAGISVVDSMTGANTSQHSNAELVQLTNILEDKIEDMDEGGDRSFAEMLWRDGSQDSKAVPGVTSIILDSPTTGVTLGLDRAANSWWRNRAHLAVDTGTASNLNLVTALQADFRQLRRYGAPKHRIYAGSDFMSAYESELRSKGNFTQTGWAKQGKLDASMDDLAFKSVAIEYEPLLDDLGKSKYGYILDMNAIKLRPMEGEDMKSHNPARPPEQFVYYRGKTWTGALCASQLNTSMVVSIL